VFQGGQIVAEISDQNLSVESITRATSMAPTSGGAAVSPNKVH